MDTNWFQEGHMVTLSLTEKERMMLADVVENYLSELRMEIGDTDSKDYRDMLKLRKEILVKILSTLHAEIDKEQA